ncbi:MAG: SoxR reducing system RseC family protein [Clostridia bacterium]|nr:SoxR reducing system RseC family protein [Clostridia bacterium]
MTNKGIVTEVSGDLLTIVFERPEACGECHNCMRGSEDCAKHTITLRGHADKGDVVEVEMDDSHVMAASALAYLIPLAGFIAGLAVGWALRGTVPGFNEELLMALCAIVGTGIAYLVMRALDPHFSKGRWEPKIVSVSKQTE